MKQQGQPSSVLVLFHLGTRVIIECINTVLIHCTKLILASRAMDMHPRYGHFGDQRELPAVRNVASIAMSTVLAALAMGCSSGMIAPITISPQQASVRIGSTLILEASQQGGSVSGGIWSITGGAINGSISPGGTYTPPPSPPPSTVTVNYQTQGQTATSTITVLNPTPVVTQVMPATLVELSTPIIVTGRGFVPNSQLFIGGAGVVTTFIDSEHLAALAQVDGVTVTSLAVNVSNPDPGASSSSNTTLAVAIAPVTISPQFGSVRLGSTLLLSGMQQGAPLSGGVWTLNGGATNGSISQSGAYTPPASLPSLAVTVTYQALGQTATSTIAVLNPVPEIMSTVPAVLNGISTPTTVIGSGFTSGSKLIVEGFAVPTTFVDSTHLTAAVIASNNSLTSLALSVSNPDPGAVVGASFPAAVAIPALTVSPLTLAGGNIAVTASLPGLPEGSIVTMDGVALTTNAVDGNSITAFGYLPFWRSGTASIAVGPDAVAPSFAQLTVPISATAVSYDVAARFAMQGAFGPRHDIIEHIQQIGLGPFIDEQLQEPPDIYTNSGSPPHDFLLNVVKNQTQLRLRTAWAFQSFIPEQGIFAQQSTLPWEETLEAHAFGNFRQILTDAASDPNVTTLLNLPGNWYSPDPNVHPNQNFARELLQLFSIGPVMLHDDGTMQLDTSGNPVPAYGEDTVLDVSRAFTGWTYGPIVNIYFTAYGIDYTQKLVPLEGRHDKGSKTIFGNVVLPAGQTTTDDRDQVLDAVFHHQNVPPFISRRLIQRFVKSQPSPAYVGRISAVFEDDGTGVRGNLAAVIKAILLDPEARAGDSTSSDDDGYVQDPLFTLIFAMELMDIDSTDDSPAYYPGQLGEPFWFAKSVFAYYSPDYVIPGTPLISPESQLLTTSLIVQRSQLLWGIINGPQTGFEPWGATWLSNTFPTVPTLVEALNHLLFHGRMTSFEQKTIADYCGGLPDQQAQLRCTLLLAMNDDSYTVVQ